MKSSNVTSTTPTPDRRFLRLTEVKNVVGLGRSAIYAKIKVGKFPAAISLGARAVAWTSDSISAWMDERIAASRKEAV